MLGGRRFSPPVGDEVQTADIFSMSGFLCSLGWPSKVGASFTFSQRSQYVRDPANLKLCLDFSKL